MNFKNLRNLRICGRTPKAHNAGLTFFEYNHAISPMDKESLSKGLWRIFVS